MQRRGTRHAQISPRKRTSDVVHDSGDIPEEVTVAEHFPSEPRAAAESWFGINPSIEIAAIAYTSA
jgi:hypothetical protein